MFSSQRHLLAERCAALLGKSPRYSPIVNLMHRWEVKWRCQLSQLSHTRNKDPGWYFAFIINFKRIQLMAIDCSCNPLLLYIRTLLRDLRQYLWLSSCKHIYLTTRTPNKTPSKHHTNVQRNVIKALTIDITTNLPTITNTDMTGLFMRQHALHMTDLGQCLPLLLLVKHLQDVKSQSPGILTKINMHVLHPRHAYS